MNKSLLNIILFISIFDISNSSNSYAQTIFSKTIVSTLERAVFYVGKEDRQVYWAWFDDNQRWIEYPTAVGAVQSIIGVTWNSYGQMELRVVGMDNQVWSTVYNAGGDWSWSGYQLTATGRVRPGGGSYTRNHVGVPLTFVNGEDDRIWASAQTNDEDGEYYQIRPEQTLNSLSFLTLFGQLSGIAIGLDGLAYISKHDQRSGAFQNFNQIAPGHVRGVQLTQENDRTSVFAIRNDCKLYRTQADNNGTFENYVLTAPNQVRNLSTGTVRGVPFVFVGGFGNDLLYAAPTTGTDSFRYSLVTNRAILLPEASGCTTEPEPLVKLYRLSKIDDPMDRRVHTVTNNPDWFLRLGTWAVEQTFEVASVPIGTTKITECMLGYDSNTEQYFNSTSETCEGAQYLATAGYSGERGPRENGIAPLFRCVHVRGGDHYLSTNRECDNDAAYRMEFQIGWAKNASQYNLQRPRFHDCNILGHWQVGGMGTRVNVQGSYHSTSGQGFSSNPYSAVLRLDGEPESCYWDGHVDNYNVIEFGRGKTVNSYYGSKANYYTCQNTNQILSGFFGGNSSSFGGLITCDMKLNPTYFTFQPGDFSGGRFIPSGPEVRMNRVP